MSWRACRRPGRTTSISVVGISLRHKFHLAADTNIIYAFDIGYSFFYKRLTRIVESRRLSSPLLSSHNMKRILATAMWLMLAAFTGFAQDEEPGKNELSVWGGFAPAVRTFDVDGRTWDGRLGI